MKLSSKKHENFEFLPEKTIFTFLARLFNTNFITSGIIEVWPFIPILHSKYYFIFISVHTPKYLNTLNSPDTPKTPITQITQTI